MGKYVISSKPNHFRLFKQVNGELTVYKLTLMNKMKKDEPDN